MGAILGKSNKPIIMYGYYDYDGDVFGVNIETRVKADGLYRIRRYGQLTVGGKLSGADMATLNGMIGLIERNDVGPAIDENNTVKYEIIKINRNNEAYNIVRNNENRANVELLFRFMYNKSMI